MIDIYNLQNEFRTGFVVEEDGVLVTPVARLSFDHLYQRTAFKGQNRDGSQQKPHFSATFLFNCTRTNEPGLVDVNTVLYAQLGKVVSEYWAAKHKPIPFDYFYGLHDGRKKQGTDGYGDGVWYLSAKNYNERMPSVPVVDGNRQLVGPDGIKAGDFVRARVRPYISKEYDNKGVNFQLKSVQLIMPWEGFATSKEDTGDEWGTVPVPTQAPVQGFDY